MLGKPETGSTAKIVLRRAETKAAGWRGVDCALVDAGRRCHCSARHPVVEAGIDPLTMPGQTRPPTRGS